MSVSRGTPQSDVISPVLGLMMIDENLPIMGETRTKEVTNAKNLVILVSENFPSVMSEIMEGVLGKICLWTADSFGRVKRLHLEF